jgi:hypothetical protein
LAFVLFPLGFVPGIWWLSICFLYKYVCTCAYVLVWSNICTLYCLFWAKEILFSLIIFLSHQIKWAQRYEWENTYCSKESSQFKELRKIFKF